MFMKNGHHLKIRKKQQLFYLSRNCEHFNPLHSEHKQNIFPSVWAFMNILPENLDFDHKQLSEKKKTEQTPSNFALFVEKTMICSSIYFFLLSWPKLIATNI